MCPPPLYESNVVQVYLTTPINLSPVADSGKRLFIRARKDQQPNQQLFFFRWPPTKCTFRLAPRKECVFGSSALQPAMSGMGGGNKMSGCTINFFFFFPWGTPEPQSFGPNFAFFREALAIL